MPVSEEDKKVAEQRIKEYRKEVDTWNKYHGTNKVHTQAPTPGAALWGGLGEAGKMVYQGGEAIVKPILPYAKYAVPHIASQAGAEKLKNFVGMNEVPIYNKDVANIVEPSAQAFAQHAPELAEKSFPGYYKAPTGNEPVNPNELLDMSQQQAPSSPQTTAKGSMGGGGGGAPAGPQETSKIGPTVRAGYEKAFQSELDAANQNAADIQRQYTEARQFWEGQAADQFAQNDAQQAAALAQQQHILQTRQNYEDTANMVSNVRIDPERFWNNKSTEDKVFSTIGLMLGALAGGKSGRNQALEMLNHQIDRDIDAQKKNWEIMSTKEGAAKNAFGMAMQQVGDIRAAEAITRAGISDALKYKVEALAAKAKGTEAQNNARTLLAALDMQKAKFIDQATAYGVAGGGGSGGMKKLALEDDHYVHLFTDPQGNDIGLYAPKHDAEKLREKKAALEQINQLSEQAIDLRNKYRQTWNLLERHNISNQIEALQTQAVAVKNHANGQGALTGKDFETTSQNVGNWNKDLIANTQAGNMRIKQAIQTNHNILNNEYNGKQLVAVKKVQDDQTGNVKQYAIQTGMRYQPGMMQQGGQPQQVVQKPPTYVPVKPTGPGK